MSQRKMHDLGANASIANAIYGRVSDPEFCDSDDGCKIGDLLDLEEHHDVSVYKGILALIGAGRAYVAVRSP